MQVRNIFESRSRQRKIHSSLHCQINMNLVFHISEDGCEIELKHRVRPRRQASSRHKNIS